jgi:RNA-directed DNA polymerase
MIVNEHIFTFKEVYNAYLTCRKQKRNTINALKFESNLECNIERLVYELNQRTYNPARSVCFTILKPKPREIFAADFRDRIVHHLLFNYLNPKYEKIFIYDSFACRKGKGTLASVKRLQAQIRSITNNNQNRAHYLQLDIHNFFMSIDKSILFNLINKHLKDETFYWLAKVLIFHDPTINYINKTPIELKNKIPEHKSLPNQKQNQGLPIGNLTSQFFANIYLNELDQFVKHKLKAKYYVRYVDDFVILHEGKTQLNNYKSEIESFLKSKLNLKLKPLIKIQPITNGINFVGYITKPFYLLPRNRNAHNILNYIRNQEKQITTNRLGITKYSYEFIPKLRNSLNSYFGHLRHSKSLHFYNSLKQRFPFLKLFLFFDYYKVEDFWSNKHLSFTNQKSFFENITKNNLLCMQVGRKYRVYNHFAIKLSTILQSKIISIKNHSYTNLSLNLILNNLDIILKNVKYCVIVKQKQGLRMLDCIFLNNSLPTGQILKKIL